MRNYKCFDLIKSLIKKNLRIIYSLILINIILYFEFNNRIKDIILLTIFSFVFYEFYRLYSVKYMDNEIDDKISDIISPYKKNGIF